MSDIRLCAKPKIHYADLLEALSRKKDLSEIDLGQDPSEDYRSDYFTFVMQDQMTLIHVIQDQSTSIPYVLISGYASQEAAQSIYASGIVYSIEEIKYRCLHDRHADDKIDAICRLGIASYFEMDREVVDIFQYYLRDPDVGVRQSAVFATSFVGWREFEKMLLYTANHDPDLRVAEIAESAIRIMRESDWLSERA